MGLIETLDSPAPPPARFGFLPREEIQDLIDQVLDRSVADETEIVWFERRRCVVRTTPIEELTEAPRLTVLVRVVEGGRLGSYRTDSPRASDLEAGIREAIALSRLQPKAKKKPVLPRADDREIPALRLADPEILALEPAAALEFLDRHRSDDERAELEWTTARLMVANSRDLRRRATATEATLSVRSGETSACRASAGRASAGRASAGRASASARSLEDLDPASVFARARSRRVVEPADSLPAPPYHVVLSPEAVIELLNLLNTHALAGRSYLDGTSFLTRHRKTQVFDRHLHLEDDALRDGLPFPFDLEGSLKRPLELIRKGTPSELALNRFQGAEAGLRPTAQAVGGGDALFGNLFLRPGDASESELLEMAEGGLWIGHLDSPECFDPLHLHVRSRARNVALIRSGSRAGSLPDLRWESSLLRIFSRLRAIGRESVVRAMPSTPLGAITAPALVLEDADGLEILAE